MTTFLGLYGALVEPQNLGPWALLAASVHYYLSAEKEAAPDGTEVSPVDKTSNEDHWGCKALCRSASSKQVPLGFFSYCIITWIFSPWLLGHSLSSPLSRVSDAWTLLKRSHSESEDIVMYFLQACRGIILTTEAVKYIPEGYSVGKSYLPETLQYHHERDCSRIEGTILQLKNKGK